MHVRNKILKEKLSNDFMHNFYKAQKQTIPYNTLWNHAYMTNYKAR